MLSGTCSGPRLLIPFASRLLRPTSSGRQLHSISSSSDLASRPPPSMPILVFWTKQLTPRQQRAEDFSSRSTRNFDFPSLWNADGRNRYWFGSPDQEGRNLATCIWRSLGDARRGTVGEAHRKAAGATRFLYTEWHIERLRLLIKEDAKEWEIRNWDD